VATGATEIVVDASVPDGTSLKVEVRTARTREGLAGAAWREPRDLPAGHRWMEARVELRGDKERRTSPLVRGVSAK
jgi:hypothetical protein